MTESVVYVPLSEETLSFVEKFKKADEDIDTFLKAFRRKNLSKRHRNCAIRKNERIMG